MGGMQLGSIWGHGGYVAPDWSADWLHREATDVLDIWAREDDGSASYARLVRRTAGRAAWPPAGHDARQYLRRRDQDRSP